MGQLGGLAPVTNRPISKGFIFEWGLTSDQKSPTFPRDGTAFPLAPPRAGEDVAGLTTEGLVLHRVAGPR